ncbi:acyltransferase [Klebsiella pneumoniae]|nr:acyltransferase [Klebsiella pneumoniae]VUL55512.1 acyltransferase [Klebsiella pneumoniae]
MVLIRAAESKDIPALKTLFLQLGYQTETAILGKVRISRSFLPKLTR